MAGKKKAPSSPEQLDQPKTKVIKGSTEPVTAETVEETANATDEKPSLPSSDTGEVGRLVIVSSFNSFSLSLALDVTLYFTSLYSLSHSSAAPIGI